MTQFHVLFKNSTIAKREFRYNFLSRFTKHLQLVFFGDILRNIYTYMVALTSVFGTFCLYKNLLESVVTLATGLEKERNNSYWSTVANYTKSELVTLGAVISHQSY